jgi:hypothetical protein
MKLGVLLLFLIVSDAICFFAGWTARPRYDPDVVVLDPGSAGRIMLHREKGGRVRQIEGQMPQGRIARPPTYGMTVTDHSSSVREQ